MLIPSRWAPLGADAIAHGGSLPETAAACGLSGWLEQRSRGYGASTAYTGQAVSARQLRRPRLSPRWGAGDSRCGFRLVPRRDDSSTRRRGRLRADYARRLRAWRKELAFGAWAFCHSLVSYSVMGICARHASLCGREESDQVVGCTRVRHNARPDFMPIGSCGNATLLRRQEIRAAGTVAQQQAPQRVTVHVVGPRVKSIEDGRLRTRRLRKRFLARPRKSMLWMSRKCRHHRRRWRIPSNTAWTPQTWKRSLPRSNAIGQTDGRSATYGCDVRTCTLAGA